MPTRIARTTWAGSLDRGSGKVELASSGLASFDVSFPRRTAEHADATSPEELLAAAQSACFAMQLSSLLGQEGGTINRLQVQVAVTLGPDPAGGFRLTGIAIEVGADVDGVDELTYGSAVQEAAATCPVSKALSGVPISVNSGGIADSDAAPR